MSNTGRYINQLAIWDQKNQKTAGQIDWEKQNLGFVKN